MSTLRTKALLTAGVLSAVTLPPLAAFAQRTTSQSELQRGFYSQPYACSVQSSNLQLFPDGASTQAVVNEESSTYTQNDNTTYSLSQDRSIAVPGPVGISQIIIHQGQARFSRSPCRKQYCVHQGWLSHAGQVDVCLPNQISLELLGGEKKYDSLNY